MALSLGFTVPPVVDLSKYSEQYFCICFIFISISISIFLLELGHKARGRPEKRVGGGGYGHFKTMNNEEQQKARKFKTIASKDAKKFTR